jgi:hypothetical protein
MGISNGIAKIIIAGTIFSSGYYLGGGCENKSHYSKNYSVSKIEEQDSKIKNLEEKVQFMEDQATKYLNKK